MKIFFTAFLILFATLPPCYAQKNIIALILNDWGRSNFRNTLLDTDVQDITTTKATLILPSFGYSRTIGPNWGVGIEMGYVIQHSSFDYIAGDNTRTSKLNDRRYFKEYFVCPSVFERINIEKYTFNFSINIPMRFFSDYKAEAYSEQLSLPSRQLQGWSLKKTKYPDVTQIGVFANAGIQRKIFKGLYGGPLLGIGIIQTSTHGLSQTITTFSNDPEQSTMTLENKISSDFDIRPTISLCYYF